jgi:hypothetical protein
MSNYALEWNFMDRHGLIQLAKNLLSSEVIYREVFDNSIVEINEG